MKKVIVLILVAVLCTGCFSWDKKTTMSDGTVIEQETNEAAMFSQHQSEAWNAYYAAILTPVVIATMTDKNGTVVKIHNQIAPPTPRFVQHENQWIKPVRDVLSTGINVIGGGLVLREIVGAMEGTNINNNGDGSVVVDKSFNTDVSTIHSEEGSSIEQLSNSGNVDNADPLVVKTDNTVVVRPEIVRPEIVRPVVVDPVIVGQE